MVSEKIFYGKTMRKIIPYLLLSFVFACSSGEKASKNTSNSNDETYVFDAVGNVAEKETKNEKENEAITEIPDSVQTQEEKTEEEETKEEVEETIQEPLYFVQIGAFQTQEAAEEFVKEAKELLNNQELTITFSDKVDLFVVQLPPFKDKKEAEKVRNRLWRYDKFKDAFIVTEE
jgi:cell division protein FtsN